MPANTVAIPSGPSTIGGYLAVPDGVGPHPAVVVIHEAYGLNDNIRQIARHFNDEGYAALAVDLFSGRNRVLCMARLMTAMLRTAPGRFGIRDLRAALDYLSTVPTVDAARLGAIAPTTDCGRLRLSTQPIRDPLPRQRACVRWLAPTPAATLPRRAAGNSTLRSMVTGSRMTSRSTPTHATPSSTTRAAPISQTPRPIHGSVFWPSSIRGSGRLEMILVNQFADRLRSTLAALAQL
jgi:hypothetical protein